MATTSNATGPVADGLRALITSLNGVDLATNAQVSEFHVGDDLEVLVSHERDKNRLRIRVYFPIDEQAEVVKWVNNQPTPQSGILQSAYLDEDDWRPRLLFERPSSQSCWSNDPLHADIDRYLTAWTQNAVVHQPPEGWPKFEIEDDPRVGAPSSAWLLLGTEAAYPSSSDVRDEREAADVGISDGMWTVSSQTRIGDLLLIYFLSPRKAVHFIARAASDAHFSRDIEANADTPVNAAQWWCHITRPIAIEPIPIKTLREAAGGYLLLRGRSGRYLRPETIAALQFRAVDPGRQQELEQVVATPIGLPTLPNPAAITRSIWRDLAAGALPLEEHVCSHIVEPLLRDLSSDSGLTWRGQYRIERRVADYVILSGDKPVHVIEVKKVINRGNGDWVSSPDLSQLRWYADHLGVPSSLIDSHRIVAIAAAADRPLAEFERHLMTRDDFDEIRAHLLSGCEAGSPTSTTARRSSRPQRP